MNIHNPSPTYIKIEESGYIFEATIPPNDLNMAEKFSNLVKILLDETTKKEKSNEKPNN